MIRQQSLPSLASAAAGTATSTAPMTGNLLAAYVATNCAGTTILRTATSPQQTLMTLTPAGSAWYYPRVQLFGTNGTVVASQYGPMVIQDYVQVVTNAAGTISGYLILDQP